MWGPSLALPILRDDIPSGLLLRVDGYSEWIAIPSGWPFRVDNYSEGMGSDAQGTRVHGKLLGLSSWV